MAKDLKEKICEDIRLYESLDKLKRYFRIESQEDLDEFQNYIKKLSNLQLRH